MSHPWQDVRPEHMGACPGCGAQLLQLRDAEQLYGSRWLLEAFCPDCEQEWLGPATVEQVCGLADAVEDGLLQLMLQAHRLREAA